MRPARQGDRESAAADSKRPRALCPMQAREVIETFEVVRDAITSEPPERDQSYIISAAEEPSDVLEVLLLMKEHGLAGMPAVTARCCESFRSSKRGRRFRIAGYMSTLLSRAGVSTGARFCRRRTRNHDRLFRFEQGHRLSRFRMGAL